MASPQDSRLVYEMGFAPLNLVDVPIGRMTVKSYPEITPAWQRSCTARRHWGMAAPVATNAVLPPRAAAVAMKTPATAMAGAQKSTIN
jgi:hypothetical protein